MCVSDIALPFGVALHIIAWNNNKMVENLDLQHCKVIVIFREPWQSVRRINQDFLNNKQTGAN